LADAQGGAGNGEIGRLMKLVVGSIGVTGGPMNDKVVGIVGENFIIVRRVWVGSATLVGVALDCWKTISGNDPK